MSLYKKSQEVLYTDFIEKTFGEEKTDLRKKLQKAGFEKVIGSVEKSEVYDKYIIPCLFDSKVSEQSRAASKSQAIEKKLKLLKKYVNIKEFFVYSVNTRSRKIKLLYGRSVDGKIKNHVLNKQLIMNDSLLQVLQQKKLTSERIETTFKKTFSWLDNTELDGCFFHVIRKSTKPEAIVVMRPAEQYDSYSHIQTPLGSLIDLAFREDINLKERKVKLDKEKQLIENLKTRTNALENFSIPHNLKHFMADFLTFTEDLNHKNGLEAILIAFKLQSLIVFEKNPPSFSDEMAIEDLPSGKLKAVAPEETFFHITFCQNVPEEASLMDVKVPENILTNDEKLVLYEKIFKDDSFLFDKASILLDISESKKILVVFSGKDLPSFEEMETLPAATIFHAFLSGMLDFYHSRI